MWFILKKQGCVCYKDCKGQGYGDFDTYTAQKIPNLPAVPKRLSVINWTQAQLLNSAQEGRSFFTNFFVGFCLCLWDAVFCLGMLTMLIIVRSETRSKLYPAMVVCFIADPQLESTQDGRNLLTSFFMLDSVSGSRTHAFGTEETNWKYSAPLRHRLSKSEQPYV